MNSAKSESSVLLPLLSTQSSPLLDTHPFQGNYSSRFYTIDGTRNNPSNVSLGGAGTPLSTLIPIAYADGISALAGENRPAPRIISNALGQQDALIPSDRQLTDMIWAFGQFLDHDLSLTPSQSREEAIANGDLLRIEIPQGDPYLDPEGTGRVAIEFRRSEFVDGTGEGPNNPRQLSNEITHWLDLSSVYGSDEERATELRRLSDGQMKVIDGQFMPIDGEGENDNPGPTPSEELFLAGDIRANENVVLSSMHTLFVREHNRIATALQDRHSGWTDEQLYQRARQINIAQWQHIIYNEYLPTLLGKGAVDDYSGYDATVDPRISRTFSTAAYRFGHTQLSSEIQRLDAGGNVIPEGNLTLFESFFPAASLLTSTGIDPIFRGITSSLSQEVDLKIIDDVRNLLFDFGRFSAARDLLSLNIQRGRDHGLADYNTIRASFGLPKVTSFADITSDPTIQQQLESLYDSVDDIDAIVGMFAEDKRPGSSTGETVSAVLADQFERLRQGDRLYYENIFTPSEIQGIESTRLSDIIERNANIRNIRENVFTLMDTPEAVDDVGTTEMNTSVSIDVLANDFDPEGDRLSISRVGRPAYGRAELVNGRLVYTPDPNFVGQDAFDYRLSDGNSTDIATVRINVENSSPTDPQTAQLGNRVWWDVNHDGRQNRGEKGITGVTVILTGAGPDGQFGTRDDSSNITTTGKKGAYSFDQLAGGDYQITVDHPDGFEFTRANMGSREGKDSDINPSTGMTDVITLIPGQRNKKVDAGLVEKVIPAEKNIITGTDKGETLWGTPNTDEILGKEGNDTLNGGKGDDHIFGDGGDDHLDGGGGNDVLSGTNPTLKGIGEQDTIVGDVGADTFVLGNGHTAYYAGQKKEDFAWIDRFKPKEDQVQLWGRSDQYQTKVVNGSTRLYLKPELSGHNAPELIAYFGNNSNVNINGNAFVYLGGEAT